MIRIKKCVKSQFIFAIPFLKGTGMLEVKNSSPNILFLLVKNKGNIIKYLITRS